jgi:hypothetical protein
MTDVVTPMQVERRLLQLSRELDESQEALVAAEHGYMKAKSEFEIESAAARMKERDFALNRGGKITINELDDRAILHCRVQLQKLNIAEAVVRAERANAVRIRTQIDIARSIGTSVRKSMEG